MIKLLISVENGNGYFISCRVQTISEWSFTFFQHLQKHESAVNPESCYYYCALCDYSTKIKLNLVQHVRSVKHQQTEGLRKLQLHQQGLAPEEDNFSDIFFVKDCPPNEFGE